MLKVLTIFGTRPEAIKMAPLVKQLKMHPLIESKVCITAQHREMLDQVLSTFDIMPDFDLNIMKQRQTLVDITSNALIAIDGVVKEYKPDIVLVHGDTTTTLAGALAAFYNQVAVGHVEAGLRTYNKYSPFPEEMNRQTVDNIADLLFAPTETSKQNLLGEGKDISKIYVTGNTAIDALAMTISTDYQHPVFDWLSDSKLLLITAHRRENLGENMRNIFTGIKRILQEFPDIKAVYPVHLNPAVRETADDIFRGIDNIKLIEPLEVRDFHNFMHRAHIILTDSGGIQEEAPSLGKPVLVVRDTTERPEGVDAGTLKLVGTSENNVYNSIKELLTNSAIYNKMSTANNPYGDGHASERIVNALVAWSEIKKGT
jgi:UDP-N-acetylglucosamine 2-epimerase (non-hydrolysing)